MSAIVSTSFSATTEATYNSTPPTVSDGASASLQSDVNGNLLVKDSAVATALSTLDGRVDGLETLIGTTNSSLTTIDGHVDGIETLIGTTNSSLSTLEGYLDALPTALGQAAMAASLPVALASDQSSLPVVQKAQAATTVKQAAISVGTTAVRCTHDGSAPSATRRKLMVQPIATSTAKFWIGSSSVTNTSTTMGIEIFPGQVWETEFDAGEYYIISNTATQTVYILEQE
jgi:hypothetical protein